MDKVKRYFGGRAEAKSFAVADAAFFGRRSVALEELRWALEGGTAPVLVTSACAGSARGIARYRLLRGRCARRTWPVRWECRHGNCGPSAISRAGGTTGSVGEAIRAIARADADVKGAASDAAYTLERLVLTITSLRTWPREPRTSW